MRCKSQFILISLPNLICAFLNARGGARLAVDIMLAKLSSRAQEEGRFILKKVEEQAAQSFSQTRQILQGPLVQFDVNNHGSGASIYEVCDRGSREICCCDVGADRAPCFDPKTISCLLPCDRHPCLSHSLSHRAPSTEAAP